MDESKLLFLKPPGLKNNLFQFLIVLFHSLFIASIFDLVSRLVFSIRFSMDCSSSSSVL